MCASVMQAGPDRDPHESTISSDRLALHCKKLVLPACMEGEMCLCRRIETRLQAKQLSLQLQTGQLSCPFEPPSQTLPQET